MSVQPNAVNNTSQSAYFYTKTEIDTAVKVAISSIANFSTSALFTNLTVSSITANPSGSISGAGLVSTGSVYANVGAINQANFSTITAGTVTASTGVTAPIMTANTALAGAAFTNLKTSSITINSASGSLVSPALTAPQANLNALQASSIVTTGNVRFISSIMNSVQTGGIYALGVPSIPVPSGITVGSGTATATYPMVGLGNRSAGAGSQQSVTVPAGAQQAIYLYSNAIPAGTYLFTNELVTTATATAATWVTPFMTNSQSSFTSYASPIYLDSNVPRTMRIGFTGVYDKQASADPLVFGMDLTTSAANVAFVNTQTANTYGFIKLSTPI